MKNKLRCKMFIQNIFIVLVLLLVFSSISTFSIGKKQLKTKYITVEANTTIWNIATQICKENEDLNVQNVVIDIKEVNNLKNSDIYQGQRLKVVEY